MFGPGIGIGVGLDLDYYRIPNLSLNFTTSATLDSRITFTRASSGTYFDSTGTLQTATTDVPRFDYNPSTLAPLGLLVEEQRTNLCLYSEDLSNAAWAKGAGVSATYNTTTAPDGTTTADTLTLSGTDNGIYQSITVNASTTYTWSWWVKLGTMAAADFKFAIYDNTAAAFIAQDIVPTQTPNSTGWTRISYTFTTPVGCTSIRVYVFRNGTVSAGTVHVWGMQAEPGTMSTSYIATTSASVTRAADQPAITGSNFLNFWNATQGTLFATVDSAGSAPGGVSIVASADDGTGGNRIQFRRTTTAGNFQGVITTAATNVFNQNLTGWASGAVKNIALAYSENNSNMAMNGVSGTLDTACTIPTVNQLLIGYASGTGWVNGHIQRFDYYARRLNDAELVNITK